jgi:hypothetical protein
VSKDIIRGTGIIFSYKQKTFFVLCPQQQAIGFFVLCPQQHAIGFFVLFPQQHAVGKKLICLLPAQFS